MRCNTNYCCYIVTLNVVDCIPCVVSVYVNAGLVSAVAIIALAVYSPLESRAGRYTGIVSNL